MIDSIALHLGRYLLAGIFLIPIIAGPIRAIDNNVKSVSMESTPLVPSSDFFDTTIYPWQLPGEDDERSPCVFLNTLANHGLVNRNGTFIDIFDIITKMEEVFSFAPEFVYLTKILPAIDCGQTYKDVMGTLRLDFQGLFAPGCKDFRSTLVRSPDDITAVNQTLLDRLLEINATKHIGARTVLNMTSDIILENNASILTLEDITSFQYNRIFEVYDVTGNDPTFRIAGSDYMAVEALSLGLIGTKPMSATVEKDRLSTFLRWERLPNPLLCTAHNFFDTHDPFYIIFLDAYLAFEDAMNLTFYSNKNDYKDDISLEDSEDDDKTESNDENNILTNDLPLPNNSSFDGGLYADDLEFVFDDSTQFDDDRFNFDDYAQFDDNSFALDDSVPFDDESFIFDDIVQFDDDSFTFDDSVQFGDDRFNFDDSVQFDDDWFPFDDSVKFDDDSFVFDDSVQFDDDWFAFDDSVQFDDNFLILDESVQIDDTATFFDDNIPPFIDDVMNLNDDSDTLPITDNDGLFFDDIIYDIDDKITFDDTFKIDDDTELLVDDRTSSVDDVVIFDDYNSPIDDRFVVGDDDSPGNSSTLFSSPAMSNGSITSLPSEVLAPSQTTMPSPTETHVPMDTYASTIPTDILDYSVETSTPSGTIIVAAPTNFDVTVVSTQPTASSTETFISSNNATKDASETITSTFFPTEHSESSPSDKPTIRSSTDRPTPIEIDTKNPFTESPTQTIMPSCVEPSSMISSTESDMLSPTSTNSPTLTEITSTDLSFEPSADFSGTHAPRDNISKDISFEPSVAFSSAVSGTSALTSMIPFAEPSAAISDTPAPTDTTTIKTSVETSTGVSFTESRTFTPTDTIYKDVSFEPAPMISSTESDMLSPTSTNSPTLTEITSTDISFESPEDSSIESETTAPTNTISIAISVEPSTSASSIESGTPAPKDITSAAISTKLTSATPTDNSIIAPRSNF